MHPVFRQIPDRERGKRLRFAWLGVFLCWIVLLSGTLTDFTTSPGILQASRLRSLLDGRATELNSLEAKIHELQGETQRLEENPAAQEHEIRRVLGYVAAGELIFDFGR